MSPIGPTSPLDPTAPSLPSPTADQGRLVAGIVVPMITPFLPTGEIDEPAVGRVVEHLLAGGIGGVFALGTTGESASIPSREKIRLVQAVAHAVRGRAVVYAGISGTCLAESIETATLYAELGARVAVAHAPYYYPVPDRNLEAYFQRLADAIPIPLVLYNIPTTTHLSLSLDLVERLSHHPNVAGIKDSERNAPRLSEMLRRCGGRPDFSVLVGSNSLYTQGLREGADGLVPSTGNLESRPYQAMWEAAKRGDWEAVERLQAETNALTARYMQPGRTLGEALAVLKGIMAAQGLCGPAMLPPL